MHAIQDRYVLSPKVQKVQIILNRFKLVALAAFGFTDIPYTGCKKTVFIKAARYKNAYG